MRRQEQRRGIMAEETVMHYALQFFKDFQEIYGGTYLIIWNTTRELDDVEKRYAKKGFQGFVGAIDCSKLF